MTLLLDTHVVLWVAKAPRRLSEEAKAEIAGAERALFSVVNLWEIVIKRALQRPDLSVDPNRLRDGLPSSGFEELPVSAAHAFAVGSLPPLHRDPFDRLLMAQAIVEDAVLMTADETLLGYPVATRRI